MREWTMRHGQKASVQNERLEKVGPDYRVGNCKTGKRGTSIPGVVNAKLNSMERQKYKNEHNQN